MRCWQCGTVIDTSANYCSSCGAYVKRAEPTSERGKALRQLYDQHGAKELLTNTVLFSNAFAESCPSDDHFQKQLGLAIDSDICNMYLTQIKNAGKPDPHFIRSIEKVLSEDVGFTKKVAHVIINAFDEMIGWSANKNGWIKKQKIAKQTTKQNAKNKKQSTIETPRKKSKMPLYIMCFSALLTITLIVLTWTVIGSDERNIIRLCMAILNVVLALMFILLLRRQGNKKVYVSKFGYISILMINVALIIFAILEWAGVNIYEYYYSNWSWKTGYYAARVFRHVQTFVFMIFSGITWIIVTLLKGTTKKLYEK